VIRQLALLTLRKGAGPQQLAAFEAAAAQAPRELPGLRASFLGRHLPGALRGGDYSWDALLESAPGLARAGACPLPLPQLAPFFDPGDARCVVESSDVVRFAPQQLGIRAPAIAPCIKRTLLLSVRPGSPQERVERFERDLLAMPRHIQSIRNWALSRTDPALQPTRWTHVWEQEYAELDGLRVDYMSHPWHWGHVDGYFDPECPQRIAELEVAHVFCAAPASILGWAA
jgi:hypothetical protein